MEIPLSCRRGDFYGVAAFEDDGEALQGVGADGHHDHAVIPGAQDRAAAGKGVAGGAGGRGNDQAIGGVLLDQVAIDGHIEPRQPADLVVTDDDVIQDTGKPLLAAVFVFQDGVDEEPGLFHIAAFQDLVDSLLRIAGGDAI